MTQQKEIKAYRLMERDHALRSIFFGTNPYFLTNVNHFAF
jgi:hypothetical protein